MICIQNVVFSKKKSDLPLYVQENHITNILSINSSSEITFRDKLSLDTYFNSFYTNFWLNETLISNLSYEFIFTGNLKISIFFASDKQDDKILHEEEYFSKKKSSQIAVSIQLKSEYKDGRFYILFSSLERQVSLHSARIGTQESFHRKIFLGIIICTYRKEEFVLKNLEWLKSLYPINNNFKVFVIDNAQTFLLKNEYPFKIHCFPNKNLGGAGGFTRGMLEACKDNNVTHVLLMDDDVEFDPEIIFRIISCFEHIEREIAISGNMIDSQNRLELFEAGALYSFKTMDVIPNLRYSNLNQKHALNALAKVKHADYAAWFCCGLSIKTIQKFGFSLPIFIRGDDIEYGVRLLKQKIPTIVIPGVAVWHESFHTKERNWSKYYMIRNLLIINYTHSPTIYPLRQIIKLFKYFLGYLCLFQYSRAKMILLGLKDFLEGPDFFKTLDIEKYHKIILETEKRLQCEEVPPCLKKETIHESKYYTKKNPIKMLFIFLTINGNLLPKFMLKNKIIQYEHNKVSFQQKYSKIYHLFGYRYIQSYNPADSSTENFQILNKKRLIGMLFQFIRLNIILLIKSKNLRNLWCNENQFLSSHKYWEEIFEK